MLPGGGAFGWSLPELRDDVTLPSRDPSLHRDDAERQQTAAGSPLCGSSPGSQEGSPRAAEAADVAAAAEAAGVVAAEAAVGPEQRREQRLRAALHLLWRRAATLRADMQRLHCDLAMEEQRVLGLLEEVRRLRAELLDARYLDDLILLLDGRLDRMPLRHWPFAVANATRSVAGDANLVI